MTEFLYKNVSLQLEKDIRGMAVGTKLPSERAMAIQYGVSRNVLREALRLLSETGLLQIIPSRGVYVANDEREKLTTRLETLLLNNESSLTDIVEVRQTLELGVFDKAVERATQDDLKALTTIYSRMEESRSNIEQFNQYDMQFHIRLAKATKNAVYPILVNTFYELTDKQLFMITQIYPSRVDSAQREHKALIEAIRNRDKENAAQIGARHFNIKDFLSGQIKKHP